MMQSVMSRLGERATVLYQMRSIRQTQQMAKSCRPIRRGTHLTPNTPSRCDRGGPV